MKRENRTEFLWVQDKLDNDVYELSIQVKVKLDHIEVALGRNALWRKVARAYESLSGKKVDGLRPNSRRSG